MKKFRILGIKWGLLIAATVTLITFIGSLFFGTEDIYFYINIFALAFLFVYIGIICFFDYDSAIKGAVVGILIGAGGASMISALVFDEKTATSLLILMSGSSGLLMGGMISMTEAYHRYNTKVLILFCAEIIFYITIIVAIYVCFLLELLKWAVF